MQKRKFKLNILDVAIVTLVLCAAVALFFRDTVNDVFAKPEISPVQIEISYDGVETASDILMIGNFVLVHSQNEIYAVVSEIGESSAKLKFNGYKKLGRYYTENGDPVAVGNEYVIGMNDSRINCRVESVEIAP